MYAIRTTEHADSDPSWTGPTITSFTELPALIGAPVA
jgi:putative hydrolase of the HAD superfamily